MQFGGFNAYRKLKWKLYRKCVWLQVNLLILNEYFGKRYPLWMKYVYEKKTREIGEGNIIRKGFSNELGNAKVEKMYDIISTGNHY